ncbi:unnamed protein product [Discosporangium mesarthrocarpum]
MVSMFRVSTKATSTGVDIRVPPEWVVTSQAVQGRKCIGTHSGTFHCDEALACAMLKLLPAWSDAVVVRTRDEAELAKCDVVVDVGGIYDPDTLRFDHHQKAFSDTLSEESFTTKLSSAGLVYRHFGREILHHMVEGSDMPKETVDKNLFVRVYRNFVEHVDAIDNGIKVSEGSSKYQISSHLSARVGNLNPRWTEAQTEDGPTSPNERFKAAMSLTSGEFVENILYLVECWWPARAIVKESIEGRMEAHPSGKVVVLTGYCPWKGHLAELEKEMGLGDEIKFVLYSEGGSGRWRIQTVAVEEGSFDFRLGLPQEWRGLRDAELAKVAGIEGCFFVHANGFIGGNLTKEGALAMASKALQME